MTRGLVLFCVICVLKTTFADQSSLYLDEIRSLSELPMDKLMQIKSSLASGNDIYDQIEDRSVSSRRLPQTLPMALPLRRSSKKPTRRYEDHYDEKGKDSKISKIFQLAITALSFLAFGGYLLTLIIMAIRRNAMNNGNENVVIFSVPDCVPNSLTRFNTYFRNLQNLQKLKRPKRNIVIFDPMENNFETDKLYEGMILLSRSYALYN